MWPISCESTLHIYNSSLALVAILGKSGVPGSNNAHFDWPDDIAIDSDGNIYVADTSNRACRSSLPASTYLRTLGETGVPGDSFGHSTVRTVGGGRSRSPARVRL